MVSLEFEYKKTIPGTCITAEIHDLGNGWWRYFLVNNSTGKNSEVHEFHLPFPLTHEQAAYVAKEIELAREIDT